MPGNGQFDTWLLSAMYFAVRESAYCKDFVFRMFAQEFPDELRAALRRTEANTSRPNLLVMPPSKRKAPVKRKFTEARDKSKYDVNATQVYRPRRDSATQEGV